MSGPPGGTAVEAPRFPARMIAAGVAIALAALVVVLVSLGGDEPARPRAAAPEPPPAAPEMVQAVAPIAPVPVTEAASGAISQSSAVEQLRRAFGKARLYSQISVQGDELELRSASCDDSQLADLLTRSRAALTESGLRRVRCLQPHGQVVFSREL